MKWAIVLILLVSGCNKNKLEGEFSSFKGKYTWKRTQTATGIGLSVSQSVLSATAVPFTAEIELDDKGQIIFYKNGEKLSTNKYTIQDKESNEFGGKSLQIRLRGKHGMNVHEDKLKLLLSFDTTLEVDRFPFPAIDDVGNYKTGHRGLNSEFIRTL